MTLLAAIAACVLLALCGWRPYVLCLSNESLAFYNKGVRARFRLAEAGQIAVRG